MTEKIEQKRTNLPVPARYYDIIDYKMLGLTYKQISEKTGYSESYIKQLFMRGGKLYEFRRSCIDERKMIEIEETLDMAHGHLQDAMRANIIDAKGIGTPVGIAARKMLFEYTLGKPEDRIKLDAKVGIYTFADWIKQQTLEKKEHEKSNQNNGGLSTEAGGVYEGGVA